MVTTSAGRQEVSWTEIRDAATATAARGWPVTPGTYVHRGRWYGRTGASGLCPVPDDWPHAGITDPAQARTIWTGRPYGLLLVCGQGVDVLELPAAAATTLPDLSRDGLGAPIAVAFPPPRWLVFLTSGAPLHPELAAAEATLRGTGEWVALPPTQLGQARARWRVPPGDDHALPGSAQVQRRIADALRARAGHGGRVGR